MLQVTYIKLSWQILQLFLVEGYIGGGLLMNCKSDLKLKSFRQNKTYKRDLNW